MNLKGFFILCSLGLASLVHAQELDIRVQSLNEVPKEKIQLDEKGVPFYYDEKAQARVYQKDSEMLVEMDELILRAKPKFNNQLDRNYYFFLNKKLSRVYPLFLTALQQYQNIQTEIARLPRSEQRKYVKSKQEALAKDYENQLRNLTTSEGRIFCKLMHRATGKTTYDIIKELRGGWSAFWWNVKGDIADVDLKAPYDPYRDRTDEYLEFLLRDGWEKGYLKPYPGYQNFHPSK